MVSLMQSLQSVESTESIRHRSSLKQENVLESVLVLSRTFRCTGRCHGAGFDAWLVNPSPLNQSIIQTDYPKELAANRTSDMWDSMASLIATIAQALGRSSFGALEPWSAGDLKR